MAERNPPSWLQGGSHPADLDRMLTRTLLPTAGVIDAAHLAVTEDDTVGMRVKVADGRAVIAGSRAPTQGSYHVVSDGPRVIDVPAADATNPRIDLVVARVRDASYDALLEDDWLLTLVPGTPAPSPAVPAAPEDSLPLAQVSVGAGATEVTNANITDLREQATTLQQIEGALDTKLDVLYHNLAPAGGTIILPITAEMRSRYRALKFYGAGRSTHTGSGDFRFVSVRVNNDFGSNYYGYQVRNNDGTLSTTTVNAETRADIAYVTSGDALPSSAFGQFEFTVENLASGINTTIKGKGAGQRGSNSYAAIIDAMVRWNNTAAITEVRCFPVNTTWEAGTRLTVVGLR